jgi:hypothetical protein
MVFEVELAFEGLVDRFDPLADAAEVAVAVGLVLAVRAEQAQAHGIGDVLELRAGEALIGQQDLPGTKEVVIVVEKCGEDLAFAEFGIGQTPHDRHPVPGTDQVELHPPVPARVRGAVAIAGMSSQV